MTAVRDDWESEVLRVAPERPLPSAQEFLWTLVDLMGHEGHTSGKISSLLKLKSCKERVSTAGTMYSTLKALMKKGLVVYESEIPNTQGKYRVTDAGFVAVDRQPVCPRDAEYWRLEKKKAEIERGIAYHKRMIASSEEELRGVEERMKAL